jgi:diguanylate cyclase (GGDEF)-like protein
LRSADSRERRWIATATDIDARKSVEVALSQSAEALALRVHHDPLTNLPNRTKLLERLSQMLADGRRDGVSLALLYVDIDHFKTVNDTLGHAAGDSLLLEVAARIVGSLRNGDIASRFGGDEFIVVCNADDIADAAAIADRVQRSLHVPMELAGKRVVVGSSIGISVFPNDGTTPSDLIAKADAAMYRAKQSGRDAWCFYSAPKDGPASDTLELEAELREAIAQDQFVVYYQPIINIDSGRVIGAEALVRWSHPTRGLLLPGDFIPIAEACGMIAPIGERVLRAACVTLGAMQLRSGDDFSLAVNISAQHFARPSFVGTIARTIEEHGIEPRRLEIEITESVVMADTETVVATLDRLSALGVRVAIDDFGTGYSSLAYIKNFPIHTLKIDRSFVSDVAVNFTDQAIAKTIITLAHSLGMRTIAEGVETAAQLERLRALGADCAQGYLISIPLAPDDFATFMARRRSGKALLGSPAI